MQEFRIGSYKVDALMMNTGFSPNQIQEILQGITIPAQPQILVDLQVEQLNTPPDLQQISELISQDVALSGMVLKFANSPALNDGKEISSIKEAVKNIGLNGIVNIINGFSIKGQMSDERIIQLSAFWDSAMDVAMTSALIARYIGYENQDECYLLGLFQNAAIPLMQARFPDYATTMELSYATSNKRVIDIENHRHDTNHAVVGYFTAKSWYLPAHICDAIADHHNIHFLFQQERQKDSHKKHLLAILKIAEHLCGNYMHLGHQKIDYEWESHAELVLEHLELTDLDLNSIADMMDESGIHHLPIQTKSH